MARKFSFLLYVTAGFLLLVRGAAFGDDITGFWNSGKAYYLNGAYQSSLRSGIGAVDLIYQKQAQKMLSLIPNLDGFTVAETNSGYTFSGQNGIIDYFLQVQKLMTNADGSIRISVDTSLNNLERYVNLIRSYDFLSDKGGYRKIVVRSRKNSWTNIAENGDAYLIPAMYETNEILVSGVLFRMSFSFPSVSRAADKDKLMDAKMKEFYDKLNVRDLANLTR